MIESGTTAQSIYIRSYLRDFIRIVAFMLGHDFISE